MSKGPKIRDIDYYEDLTGQTIGRLTIVSLDKDSLKRRWRCVCSCGNIVTKTVAYFRHSPNPSCGCVGKEKIQQQGWDNKKKNVWDENIYSRKHLHKSGISPGCYFSDRLLYARCSQEESV